MQKLRPLIAGNWKMHGSKSQVKLLMDGILAGVKAYTNIDILVLPTLVHLSEVREMIADSSILLGAQNLYLGSQGAYTGEVSGLMLAEVGCEYVLVGHSERRTIFHEDLDLIAQKLKAALAANLKPILCIGETRAQREEGQTEQVIREQLESAIEIVGIEAFQQITVAYEPVWAIGTGLTATPEQAQEAHAYIRHLLSQINVDIAKTIRILYGGSMKAENAASLLAMPDINGGLIGGASLEAKSFLAICAAANHEILAAKAG